MDFKKLETTKGQNKNGLGLGLSICKAIVEQLGGSITVHSEVGKGTVFRINLKTFAKLSKL